VGCDRCTADGLMCVLLVAVDEAQAFETKILPLSTRA
jgi:hypothetical protein